MPHLLDPLTIRSITFPNRVFVSPMCEYSSEDGFANDWHLVHLGSRAVGGAGLVFTEATAVTPEGRISPQDLGIWKDEHVDMLARIVRFVQGQGSVPGMQLAHAGRKASTYRPWSGNGRINDVDGGWRNVLAPSAIKFADNYPLPIEMTPRMLAAAIAAFAAATRRAFKAGFRVLEIHAAHGYLLHEFLSPLSNHRTDEYGGPFENRIRFVKEVVTAVRQGVAAGIAAVHAHLGHRLGGGRLGHRSIRGAGEGALKPLGVDFIDCSSGGNVRAGDDSARPRLPGAVCRANSPEARVLYRRRRTDHLAAAGRRDCVGRAGRRGGDGAGVVARSVFSAASRTRARAGDHVAGAGPARRTSGRQAAALMPEA